MAIVGEMSILAGTYGGQLLQHPTLQRLRNGEVSRKNLELFSYHPSNSTSEPYWFDVLLNNSISEAIQLQDDKLKEVLQDNLDDESGQNEERSHAEMRSNYYRAIGFIGSELPVDSVDNAAATYKVTMMQFARMAKPYAHLGALFFIEYFIPRQFHLELTGLEKIAPDQFSLTTARNFEDAERIMLAREYLAGHVKNDAQTHIPELAKAIHPHLKNHQEEVLAGMAAVAKAKETFFSAIGEALLVNYTSGQNIKYIPVQ